MKNEKVIRSPDTLREQRVPPGQSLTERFPVLHHGEVQKINITTWKFAISGLVDRSVTLTYAQFLALPMMKVFSDIHCVTGWSRLDNLWEGVSTQVIKKLTRLLPEAKYVMVHAAPAFTANLPVEDFFAEDALLAVKHNGVPLTPEHGYPVRLVIPRLYFWKSAKWVTGVEFMEKDKPGFWESAGYHQRGDPWREERYRAGS